MLRSMKIYRRKIRIFPPWYRGVSYKIVRYGDECFDSMRVGYQERTKLINRHKGYTTNSSRPLPGSSLARSLSPFGGFR